MPSHYEVLGVDRDASHEDIRQAFRRLARQHHPDLAQTPDSSGQMSRITEAYRVLGDPERRVRYDRGEAEPSSAGADERSTAADRSGPSGSFDGRRIPYQPSEDHPRFPWRPIVVLGLAAPVILAILSLFSETSGEPEPDNLLRVGSCVSIDPNGDAREVRCTGAEWVVSSLVPFGGRCPVGTEGHRDRQGLGIACVVPAPESAASESS